MYRTKIHIQVQNLIQSKINVKMSHHIYIIYARLWRKTGFIWGYHQSPNNAADNITMTWSSDMEVMTLKCYTRKMLYMLYKTCMYPVQKYSKHGSKLPQGYRATSWRGDTRYSLHYNIDIWPECWKCHRHTTQWPKRSQVSLQSTHLSYTCSRPKSM